MVFKYERGFIQHILYVHIYSKVLPDNGYTYTHLIYTYTRIYSYIFKYIPIYELCTDIMNFIF